MQYIYHLQGSLIAGNRNSEDQLEHWRIGLKTEEELGTYLRIWIPGTSQQFWRALLVYKCIQNSLLVFLIFVLKIESQRVGRGEKDRQRQRKGELWMLLENKG